MLVKVVLCGALTITFTTILSYGFSSSDTVYNLSFIRVEKCEFYSRLSTMHIAYGTTEI